MGNEGRLPMEMVFGPYGSYFDHDLRGHSCLHPALFRGLIGLRTIAQVWRVPELLFFKNHAEMRCITEAYAYAANLPSYFF
jgi:hypothetical protein